MHLGFNHTLVREERDATRHATSLAHSSNAIHPIGGVHSTSGANRTIHSTMHSRSSTMPTKLDVELTTTKWLRDYIVLQASDAGILY